MKMKRVSSVIKIICFCIFVGFVVFLRGCIIQIRYNPYKNIPQESEEIPNYVEYNTVHRGKDEICVSPTNNIPEFFVLNDEKLYFVDDKYDFETDTNQWYLTSFDINTEEVQIYCVLDDVKDSYRRELSKDYKERDGYYKDGKIVLNDKENVLVFDIDSQDVQKYLYEEYEFPEQEIYGEFIGDDTIRIVADGKEELWNLEKMAETSTSIDKLYAFESKLNYVDVSYLEYFYSSYSIQCIEDKMYIIGNGLNYKCSSFAIILEYDTESSIWQYITSFFTWDKCHGDVYVIPQYS